MKTLELIQTESYDKNIDRGGMNPCARCGKDVKNEKYRIHLIDGGCTMLAVDSFPEYVSDAGDCGMHPIGSECKKHIPKEFIYTK